MWIDDASDEILRAWVKHSPTQKLVSTLDGQILWANSAFCEWSQYTLSELRKLTWMQISVPDKNLDADIEETKHLDAYNPSYTVRKQYIPKACAPEWGQLTVMRYPLTGEIQCCLCTWEPLKNGTAKAFAMAMDHTQEIDRKLAAMTAEIQTLTKQTDEDKFVLGTIRLVQRHPRMAVAFLFVAASVFGLNNIVELLQRTGLINLPVPVKAVSTGSQAAHEIANSTFVSLRSMQLRNGITVEWEPCDDGATRPVSIARGRSWTSGNRVQPGVANADGQSGSIDSMSGRASAASSGSNGDGTTF